MKTSKKELIEKIVKNPDVEKTVEAIVRTPSNSKAREIALKAFEFKFVQIGTNMFKDNIGCTYDDDILVEVKLSAAGWLELLNIQALTNDIFKVLLNEANISFEIGTKEDLYIAVNEFTVGEERTTLKISVYYTGDEKVDEKIDYIIQSLRKC